ncbi:hypothetical protein DLS45_13945, partial [Staphylococcus pseudintermedius]
PCTFFNVALLHGGIALIHSMEPCLLNTPTPADNRRGRSRHLARKLRLRRKRSRPNVFEMAATETLPSIERIKFFGGLEGM